MFHWPLHDVSIQGMHKCLTYHHKYQFQIEFRNPKCRSLTPIYIWQIIKNFYLRAGRSLISQNGPF